MDQILNNLVKTYCDRNLARLHARLIVGTYEMHNYCRCNDRPIRSLESGETMMRRILKDVHIRAKNDRRLGKLEKRSRRAGVLAFL